MQKSTLKALRSKWHPPITNAEQAVSFQAIDWYPHDVQVSASKSVKQMSYEEKQEFYKRTDPRVTFQMDVFGVGPEGETYTLKIGGFQPYFFVRLPDGTSATKAKDIVRFLQESDYFLSNSMKNEFNTSASRLEPYFAYHGYQFGKKHPFLKLVFHSDRARKRMARQMERGCKVPKGLIPGPHSSPYYYFQLYESNVESLIRFFHDTKLNPCGWLNLDAHSYIALEPGNGDSHAYCTLECEASHVQASSSQKMAKTMICSFDIEADSSHGDFPLAVKDYTKPANELIHVYLDYLDRQVDVRINRLVSWLQYMFRQQSSAEEAALDDVVRNNISVVYTKQPLTEASMPDFQSLAIEMKILFNEATSSDVYEGDSMKVHIPGKTNTEKDFVENIRNLPECPSAVNQYDKEYYLKKKKRWVRLLDADGLLDKRNWRISRDGDAHSYAHMKPSECKRRKPRLFSKLVRLLTTTLPEIRGDRVIQIGSVFWRFGEDNHCFRHLLTLDTCDDIEDAVVESFDKEEDLLVRWAEMMRDMSPHIVTGYNIFGFDYKFMWERANVLGVADAFGDLSQLPSYSTTLPHRRHASSLEDDLMAPKKPGGAMQCRCKGMHCKLLEKELTSAGLGENRLFYMDVPGMVQIDMCKDIMKDHNLSSYKLDDVASTFIHGRFTHFEQDSDGATTVLWSDNAYGINQDDYIYLYRTTVIGEEPIEDGQKFQLASVDTIDGKHRFVLNQAVQLDVKSKYEWGLGKDDVGPQQIFKMQFEGPSERAIIGKYCLQDCKLVLTLMMKLQTVSNNFGMARVCSVPFQYIFTRGQGIKTFSLVSRECALRQYRIPQRRADGIVPANLPREEQDAIFENGFPADKGEPPETKETYQGAFVLEPKSGIYLNEAIAVLDYSSLYPSSQISHNLCPSSIVLDKEYLGDEGGEKLKAMGLVYRDVTYDNYISVRKGSGSGATYDRIRNTQKPTTTCRFIQPPRQSDGSILNTDRGVLPQTLQLLLSQRKATKKKMKKEKDPFASAVLDGLQLAYKVTANSVYGSLGAQTNPIFFKDIAAATTATGREMLLFAKDFVLSHYPGSDIIYGDTDSIFIHFHPKDEEGNELKGQAALERSIELGIEAGKRATNELQVVRGLAPQDLEYEKTFLNPIFYASKKKYIGYLFEEDPHKGKLKYMGIVLKRRDNARIVKSVYADVIDALLNKKSLAASIDILQSHMDRLLNGQVHIRDLIISKSLRSHYANPQQIVHKVLADRMADRDPGNKPQANDRIPFVYVDVGNKQISSQGERVEHPDYIQQHNLKIDALFYITNQISKPISQIYGLVVEQLPGYKHTLEPDYFKKQRLKYKNDEKEHSDEWIDKKITDMRVDMAEELLFGDYVRQEKNRRNGSQTITQWFQSSKSVKTKSPPTTVSNKLTKNTPTIQQSTLTQWAVKC